MGFNKIPKGGDMSIILSVNGFSGVGKSTVLQLLSERNRVLWIPRVTTRPPRKRERRNTEYEFVSLEEYEWRLTSGKRELDVVYEEGQRPPDAFDPGNDIWFSTSHRVSVRKKPYLTGIPNPRLWPALEASPYVDVVLFTSGYASPEIKKHWDVFRTAVRRLPNSLSMVTVFITMTDTEKMRKRLYKRCRKENIDFGSKWAKNVDHFGDDFGVLYDHVIYNDGTIEECVRQLEVIAGLRPAMIPTNQTAVR